MAGLWQIVAAELRRRWSVNPISSLMSSVLFPAIMLTVLFYLPQVDPMSQRLDLLTAAVSVEGGGTPGGAAWEETVLDALREQPLYRIEKHTDAKAAYEAGDVAVAVILSPPNHVEIHRHRDFFSSILVDRLAQRVYKNTKPVLRSATVVEEKKAEDARAALARVGLFILIGFAWFFTSSGVIERFVAEKERRTLESLLSTSVPKNTLVQGRLLEICIHGALPQLSCAGALLMLGFSPYSLCLPLLTLFLLYPFTLFCFWLLKDTEEMMSAGWRTGVSFMFVFPLLILMSDVLGKLSPFYQVAKALTGPPTWSIYLPTLGLLMGLSALSWHLAGRVSKSWGI